MKVIRNLSGIVLGLVLVPGSVAEAAVVSSSSYGFVSANEAVVQTDAAGAYAALVNDVSQWWDAAHTWSGDSRNLTIDARAAGCFCEAWDDQSVQHMVVTYVHPGVMLRMRGALGPLQASGLTGSMTWSFEPQDDSTKITLRYSVGGFMQGELQEIAPVVDGVLRGQLARLTNYIDKGSPVGVSED